MGLNSWYHNFPTSDPLDMVAGDRYEKRKDRMTDSIFAKACELAGIPVTPRQARKWNQKMGLALKHRNQALKEKKSTT